MKGGLIALGLIVMLGSGGMGIMMFLAASMSDNPQMGRDVEGQSLICLLVAVAALIGTICAAILL